MLLSNHLSIEQLDHIQQSPPIFRYGNCHSNNDFRAKIIIILTFSIITNFRTDSSLNNFQEHLFELLRLKKYQMSHQNFFPMLNKAVKHELVEFEVQCLRSFVAMAKNPPSCF